MSWWKHSGLKSSWCDFHLTWRDQWAGTCRRLSIWPTPHAEPDDEQERERGGVGVGGGCRVCLPVVARWKSSNSPQRQSWRQQYSDELVDGGWMEWMKPDYCSLSNVIQKPREKKVKEEEDNKNIIPPQQIICFNSWIKGLLFIFWPELIVCCCCFFHVANLHSKDSFYFAPSFEIQVSQWMLRLCPERSSASQKCLLNLNSNLWQC